MTDTVSIREWIEERRAIIHGAREAIRPAEAIDLGLIDLPRALNALEQALGVHTRISVEHAIYGPTDACQQCSEDRLYTLWPCETVEAIEGAINE